MKKKLFALFLVLALTVCLLPASALAAPPYMRYTKENQPWRLKNAVQMTATEEADGVSAKMRSAKVSAEVATQGVEVTEPREICMPQSFSAL